MRSPIYATDWRVRTLGECAAWLSGGTPRKSTPEYWGGSIPWISAKSLDSFFIEDSEDRVTPLGVENGTRLVPKNTVLFIVRGMSLKTEFRMGITTRPVTFNQDLKALLARDGMDPKFLAYAVKSMTPTILGLVDEAGHGTGRLATDLLQALEIPTPPVDEQRRIAAILGALDDKIELNRKMNRTLEEMAQALFKSWFIDFDGHDDLVDSEIGPVPRGWEVGQVSDLAHVVKSTVNPGASPETYWEHYSLPAFDAGRRPVIEQGLLIKSNKLRVNEHCVLVSKLNPHIPRVWLPAVGDASRSICSTEFVPLLPRHPSARPFLYGTFTSTIGQHAVASMVGGTTGSHQRVRAEDLLSLPIVKPPSAALETFSRATTPLLGRVQHNIDQGATLASLRDTLLPKLISGELRVPEAEAAVAEAL